MRGDAGTNFADDAVHSEWGFCLQFQLLQETCWVAEEVMSAKNARNIADLDPTQFFIFADVLWFLTRPETKRKRLTPKRCRSSVSLFKAFVIWTFFCQKTLLSDDIFASMDRGAFLNHSSQLQEESIERLKIVNSMKEKIQQDGSFIFLFVYNKLVWYICSFYLFPFQFSVCSCELGHFWTVSQ